MKKIIPIFILLCTIIASCGTSPTNVVSLRGTNLVGGEISYTQLPPVENTNYLWVSHQDIDYVVSKNMNFARLTFSWEAMQPTLNGALATSTYATEMQDRVNYIASKGMYVMIEPHGADSGDFARYRGNPVGSAQVPNTAFADFWSRMATLYKSNPKVIFGLSNEPHDMGTMQWFNAAQAAINAIRATGSVNMIMVPGNGYTGASDWSNTWYDTSSPQVSNATAWLTLKDPVSNTIASVHEYFDSDASGSTTGIVSPTVGQDRLSGVVAWARANGVKVHVSEFGASVANSGSQTAITNFLNYINANSDVIIGWSWWAYGPPSWWGGYQFTLDPTNNYTTDDPKMAWLKPYLATTPVDAGTDTGSLPPPTDAGSAVDAGSDSGTVIDAGTDAGTPLVLTPVVRITYKWATGYCEEVDLVNKNTKTLTWSQIGLNLRGGTIRDQNNTGYPWDTWSGVFSARTGVITVKPVSYNKSVPAGSKATFGYCADFGPLKWTGTIVSGSLVMP